MDHLLSITQLAKLRGVTSETLRHYDRIGLFQPVYIDPNTNYRYYSILQYEKLGTIIELRQLGMSLEEIKLYFEDRNVNKSLILLQKKYDELTDKIKEMQERKSILANKLKFLNTTEHNSQEVLLQEFPKRTIISFQKPVSDDFALGYSLVNLERHLKETSPILGSNRIGALVPLDPSTPPRSFIPFVFCHEPPADNKLSCTIPAGTFACFTTRQAFGREGNGVARVLQFIEAHGYTIVGDMVQCMSIDITLTDVLQETRTTVQIPIQI